MPGLLRQDLDSPQPAQSITSFWLIKAKGKCDAAKGKCDAARPQKTMATHLTTKKIKQNFLQMF